MQEACHAYCDRNQAGNNVELRSNDEVDDVFIAIIQHVNAMSRKVMSDYVQKE